MRRNFRDFDIKLFEIRGGKFSTIISPQKFKGFIIGSLIIFALTLLSNWLGFDQKELWKLYNFIIKEFNIDYKLPQEQREEQLEVKIESDVDSAIREYERLEHSYPPRMTNKTILENIESSKFTDTQRLIVKDAIYYECPGGVMGIRAHWVDKDPNCD